jgi:hypothetical protein
MPINLNARIKMSLESKIELLTQAIDRLNKNLEAALQPVAAPVQQVAEVTPPTTTAPVEAVKVEEVAPIKTVSADDVQASCLSLSRKDPANKAKIKTLLSEFKASKIADLSEQDLLTFSQKLGQL